MTRPLDKELADRLRDAPSLTADVRVRLICEIAHDTSRSEAVRLLRIQELTAFLLTRPADRFCEHGLSELCSECGSTSAGREA